jgi:spore germination protein YaaH
MDVTPTLPRRLVAALLALVALASLLAAASVRAPVAAAQASATLHAFVLVSDPSSFRNLQEHADQVGTIYPTYFRCDRTAGPANGQILGSDDSQISAFAREQGITLMPRFDCQHRATLHAILTDAALRQRTLDELTALVTGHDYDGLNLDFEAAPPTDRDALTSFVTDLAARLHDAGARLSICVSAKQRDDPAHPRSGLYDYSALARAADTIFVMAWGIHWQTSAPGPIADWPWYTGVVDYVASLPDPERYVIGAPLYGFDWPDGGGGAHPGVALQYADVVALADRVGATPQFDPAAHEMHFDYTGADALPHQVWFMNARAVLDRFGYARDRGFAPGVWRLGREDQALWTGLG